MTQNKKNELRDYLYQAIQKMGLDKKEMQEISEYTDTLIESFVPMLSIIDTEKNKDLFAKSLSKLIEDMHVKRNA